MPLAHDRAAVAALLLALTLTGCKQSEGDRCQMDSDCAEGLICCTLTGASTEGTCQLKARCNATDGGADQTTYDAMTDLGAGDAAADRLSAADSAAADAARPDTAAPQPDLALPDTKAAQPPDQASAE